jgi:hypothetical protein
MDNCIVARWRKTWIELTQLRILAEMDAVDQPVPASPETTAALFQIESADSCMQ